jgi:hypothetical protein
MPNKDKSQPLTDAALHPHLDESFALLATVQHAQGLRASTGINEID